VILLRRHGVTVLLWLPAVTAAVYLATVAAMSVHLVNALYWDTDVAAPFVLAERLRGEGPVYIPHYGSWSLLWSLLATRDLPGHTQLWEAMGYPFALATAGLLGWATSRVAGRWAGVVAAATSLLVGPVALRSLLTVIYHVTTPFTAAVLGAYLVTLTRTRSRPLLIAAAVAAGLLAGVNAASDPLLWVAGVAPFAIAAAVLAAKSGNLAVALQAGITLAVAACSAVATHVVMRRLDFHVVGLDLGTIAPGELATGIKHLGRMVALLGGANYALPGPYPGEPLRIIVALLFIAAVGSAVAAAIQQIARRAEPTPLAYSCYWAAAAILLCVTFVVTPNALALGAGSMNYLLTLGPAAGAGLALLAVGSWRRQLAAALAVVTIGTVNIASLLHGEATTAKGAIGTYEPQIVRLLEDKGVTRGYAGYWDAQNLSWQSGMRLLVAPIERCDLAGEPRLCGFNFSTIASWYKEHAGQSFLIVDPGTAFITEAPPIVREASASYRFGKLTVYVFPYDLARDPGSSRMTRHGELT
jgi:hypothetical protein